MLAMNPVACHVSISRAILGTILFALFSVFSSNAIQWDSAGAALAFQEASLKRSEISQTVQAPLSLYLECAKAYGKVHTKDPHYIHTGTAIYEEALLYQEMGDRFSDLEFYRKAAKRFQLLVKDYDGNNNCPDALRRLGDIYRMHLKDETAAQNAYQVLRTQYKGSSAAHKLPEKETIQRPQLEPLKPVDIPPITRASATSLIQNIRHWSTGEYTRVTIDMDSDAEYSKERLSNPERIYFDMANAKVGRDLQARTISVEDEFLKQIRISPKSGDTIRIVLDLAQKSDYSISELHGPFRLVIDLYRRGATNAALKNPPPEPTSSGIKTAKDVPKNNPVLKDKTGKPESPAQRETATVTTGSKPFETKPKEPLRPIAEPQPSSDSVAKPAPASTPTAVAKAQPSAGPKEAQKPVDTSAQSKANNASAANPIFEAKVKLQPVPAVENRPSSKSTKAGKPDQEAIASVSSGEKAEAKVVQAPYKSAPLNAGIKQLPHEPKPDTKANTPEAASRSNSVGMDKTAPGKDENSKTGEIATSLPPVRSPDTNLRQPPRAVTEISSSAAGAVKPAEASVQSNSQKSAPANPIMNAKVMLPPLSTADSQSSSKAIKSAPETPSRVAPEKSADVNKVDMESAMSRSPKAAPPTSRGDRTLTRMLGLKIGRIVLDPGHGGHDLGSVGPGGLLEKDLVLSLAVDLQKLLQEKLGADVILTRYDDIFISLEERTSIANQYRADLFISIHANSSRARSISGVETYYLDFAKTESEREIAARENATTATNIHELENLIKKIAQADKAAESRELALIVQRFLYTGAKKAIPSTQNRGVRSAPFIVLIGAKMPSVLAEVAFLSNPKVEKLLKRTTNQESLVKALFSGIEGYVKTLGSEFVQNQIRIK